MVVHRGIFFNEKVARWNVGLRLIEVVVGNEILHCVFGKEIAHLGIGLRGQRLIGRKDDGRHPLTSNDVGHREGFARPGKSALMRQKAEQSLEMQFYGAPYRCREDFQ